MPAHIKTESSGQTSAFTSKGKLVMNYGQPVIAWSFMVKDLENWLTTIEETINDVPPAHRRSLEKLYFSLKAAHKRHVAEHEQVVSDVPNADDLMQYLASYAAALSIETMEKQNG